MGFVPPIQPSFGAGGAPGGIDPQLTQFKLLWDNWWNNPTKKNAMALLNFLKDPVVARDFAKNASERMPPYRVAVYSHDYHAAISSLQDWIKHGCPADLKQIPSQFIAYVYAWQTTPKKEGFSETNTAVEQYQEHCDNWQNNPTKENGEVLLAFLEDPRVEGSLMQRAGEMQIDYPEAQFSRDYRYAVGSLNDWLESGCNPLAAPACHQLLSNLGSWLT